MIDSLIGYLLINDEGVVIDKEWSYIDEAVATPMGIYGFKKFKNEEELKRDWINCSYELSTKVQANLSEELDNFRWDIYLIFYVEDQISTINRKLIENDKKFFRKIVLNNFDKDIERVPFIFSGKKSENVQEVEIYIENLIFLKTLKETLDYSTIQILGEDFFEAEDLNSDSLFLLLNDRSLNNEN